MPDQQRHCTGCANPLHPMICAPGPVARKPVNGGAFTAELRTFIKRINQWVVGGHKAIKA